MNPRPRSQSADPREDLRAQVGKPSRIGQPSKVVDSDQHRQFRFVYDIDWIGPWDDAECDEEEEREKWSAFYNYSEPFCCECRAFGRLQEDGHEDLAVDCFVYVLLDEEHERVLLDRFPNITLNGNIELPDAVRSPWAIPRTGRQAATYQVYC